MDVERLLRKIVLIGLYCIPFLALISLPIIAYSDITLRNFSFRYIVEVLFLAWLILAVRYERYRFFFSPLLGVVVCFLAVVFIADMLGVNPFRSVWSNAQRMMGLVTLLHLLMYLIVLVSFFKDEKYWRRWFAISIGVSVAVAVLGLLQVVGIMKIQQANLDVPRITSTLSNSTELAAYMLFHIFLTVFFVVRYKRDIIMRLSAKTALYGCIIVLQTYTLYRTATRGAALALFAAVLFAFVTVLIFDRRPIVRRVVVGGVVGIILIIGGLFAFKDSPLLSQNKFVQRITSSTLHDNQSIRDRLILWNSAWEGFKERPLLGWGEENYILVFNKYYTPEMYNSEQWFDRPHNVFLEWLVAGGIAGFFAYLTLLLTVFYYCAVKLRFILSLYERVALCALLVAYVIQNIFLFDTIITYTLFFALIAYLHVLNQQQQRSVRLTPLSLAAVPLVIVVLVAFVANTQAYVSLRSLQKARVISAVDPAASAALFEKSLRNNSYVDLDVLVSFPIVNPSSGIAAERLIKEKVVDLGVRAVAERPKEFYADDARFYMFAGNLNNFYGNSDDAISYFQRVLELSPKKVHAMVELGSTYLNEGRYGEAEAILKEAHALAPAYRNARVMYAVALIYQKNDVVLSRVLEEEFGTVYVSNDNLLKAYADTGQHEKVIEILKKRIQERKPDPKLHVQIALAYFLNDQKDHSVEHIERIIELDPRFAEEGKRLIREIQTGRNPFGEL